MPASPRTAGRRAAGRRHADLPAALPQIRSEDRQSPERRLQLADLSARSLGRRPPAGGARVNRGPPGAASLPIHRILPPNRSPLTKHPHLAAETQPELQKLSWRTLANLGGSRFFHKEIGRSGGRE